MKHLKLNILGDGAVGKTSFLIVCSTNTFPTEYITNHFDNYSINLLVDEQVVCLMLWDTAGQDEYDRLRPLSYPQTDVFIFSYSIASRSSFERITTKWLPEATHHCQYIPYVLVAMKTDLRETQETPNELISYEEGMEKAEEIGAAGFHECSSLKVEGIQEACMTAAIAALQAERVRKLMKKPRHSQCLVM